MLVRAAVIDEPEFVPVTDDDDTIAARIYRCPVDQAGALVPFLLVELLEDDVANSWGGWLAVGRFVYFGWSGMSDDKAHAGLGIIDLATGGWARNITAVEATLGRVSSAVEWRNELWFTVNGKGVYRTNAKLVPAGYFDTDHSDFASTPLKTIDEYRAIFEPLPVETSVTLMPSFDWGGSYIDLGMVENRAGATQMAFEKPRDVMSVGLRVSLTADSTFDNGPVIKVVQLRLHQQGLADQVIEVPVEVTDEYVLRTGAAAPDAKPGYGVTTTRWLESLTQALVAYQDIDYAWIGLVEVWQIVQVESLPVIEYDDKQGKATIAGITRVTLRRSLVHN